MNNANLVDFLKTIYPISSQLAEKLVLDFNYYLLAKNSILIKENSIVKQTYFLESGYIRSFVIDHFGNEVTTNIYFYPCFVNDFSSFFKQIPAKQNFHAITECKIWTMSFENVEKNFHNSPEFREFGRLLILNHYDLVCERVLSMIKDNAEIRYYKLLSKHKEIFKFIPLKIIASYLGITDTSLSRIRKTISHK